MTIGKAKIRSWQTITCWLSQSSLKQSISQSIHQPPYAMVRKYRMPEFSDQIAIRASIVSRLPLPAPHSFSKQSLLTTSLCTQPCNSLRQRLHTGQAVSPKCQSFCYAVTTRPTEQSRQQAFLFEGSIHSKLSWKTPSLLASSFHPILQFPRVAGGSRTHDLQGHNLAF